MHRRLLPCCAAAEVGLRWDVAMQPWVVWGGQEFATLPDLLMTNCPVAPSQPRRSKASRSSRLAFDSLRSPLSPPTLLSGAQPAARLAAGGRAGLPASMAPVACTPPSRRNTQPLAAMTHHPIARRGGRPCNCLDGNTATTKKSAGRTNASVAVSGHCNANGHCCSSLFLETDGRTLINGRECNECWEGEGAGKMKRPLQGLM